MRKNSNTPVLFLLDESDVPYTLWVFLNGRNMWHHKWRYSEENKECPAAERAKYLKYNKMSESQVRNATHEERLEHVRYAVPKGKFVEGEKRQMFCETVSEDGRKILSKFIKGWRKLLADEAIKDKIEIIWLDMEDRELLEDKIWRGNKRKRDDENDDIEMPELPPVDSPTSVILFPGDEGYEDYVKNRDGDSDSSSDEEDN